MMNENPIKKCLCCNSVLVEKVLKLVDSPLTDAYSNSKDISLKKKKYPLELYLCKDCNHLQLGYQVPPEESYKEYMYNSKITPGLNKSFLNYAETLAKRNFKNKKIELLDIGSNDGSFLEACKNIGFQAIGIEPAVAVANHANSLGRKTINAYLDKELKKLLLEKGLSTKFDFITFNNVLANINEPIEAIKVAKLLLKDKDSEIVIQTGYHPLQFSKGLFDYIYHEHFSYFSINSIRAICNQVNLKIDKYSISDLRGGSIRFYLKQAEDIKKCEDHAIERFSSKEEIKGLEVLVNASKLHLENILNNYKRKNFKIIGYGASHSTGILVSNLDLTKYLDFLVDENKTKHGLYMPGTSLKVHNTEKLYNSENSVALILAWQYFDLIRDKLINNNFKGIIVRPILP